MDDELEHSPRSWLDDFTQRFSWCRPSVRALPFLNNYFLPGVSACMLSALQILQDKFAAVVYRPKRILYAYRKNMRVLFE